MAEAAAEEVSSLKGIAGWLLLPAIVCVVNPIAHCLSAFETISLIGRIQSRVRSAFYLDAMLGFILAVGFVFAAYLMWNHRREFPTWFIGLLVAGVAKVLLLAFLLALNGVNSSAIGVDFARAAVPALIWIPYILLSKRVAVTFRA